MEKEERKDVLKRKEKLDQEFNEIRDRLKSIANILSDFSYKLGDRPDKIVIVDTALAQNKQHDDKIYIDKNQLKYALNLEIINDYLMSLEHYGRELELMANKLND